MGLAARMAMVLRGDMAEERLRVRTAEAVHTAEALMGVEGTVEVATEEAEVMEEEVTEVVAMEEQEAVAMAVVVEEGATILVPSCVTSIGRQSI